MHEIDRGDLPEEWFTPWATEDDEEDFDAPADAREQIEPDVWVPLHSIAPELNSRLAEQFSRSVRELGDLWNTNVDGVRLDVSTDGSPRQVRLAVQTLPTSSWYLYLWSNTDLDQWVRTCAVESLQAASSTPPATDAGGGGGAEYDDQAEAPDQHDDSYWMDPDQFAYELVTAHHADIDQLLDRYAQILVHVADIDAVHTADVRGHVVLEVTTNAEPPIVRCTSTATGETMWLYEWDGQTRSLTEFIEAQALQHAGWISDEHRLGGHVPWDE